MPHPGVQVANVEPHQPTNPADRQLVLADVRVERRERPEAQIDERFSTREIRALYLTRAEWAERGSHKRVLYVMAEFLLSDLGRSFQTATKHQRPRVHAERVSKPRDGRERWVCDDAGLKPTNHPLLDAGRHRQLLLRQPAPRSRLPQCHSLLHEGIYTPDGIYRQVLF